MNKTQEVGLQAVGGRVMADRLELVVEGDWSEVKESPSI